MKQTADETRYQRGLTKLIALGGNEEEEIAPMGELGRYIVEFGFGDIYNREGLSLRERELVAVAMLVAMGGREMQLQFHMRAALKLGLTAERLEELILQTVPFAGFPTAINAFKILKEIETELATPKNPTSS